MKRPAVVLLIASAALSNAAWKPSDLVGIWQTTHEIAAGWNANLCFFANGKVDEHTNQMDLDSRLRGHSGTWKLKGNTIYATYTTETVLVGGHRAKPGTTGDGEFSIIGYKIVTRPLKRAVTGVWKLGALTKRDGYPSALIGKTRYWRMKNDPKDYE